MKFSLLLLLAFLFTISCKPGGTKPTNAEGSAHAKTLEEQLMAIHDEVMPRLNDIQHLSADMRKIKEKVGEDANGKLVNPDGYDARLDAMKLAEQGMWDWMKQYHDTRDSIPADQLVPYLEKQLQLINSVKMGVDTSIAKAQLWLNQYAADEK